VSDDRPIPRADDAERTVIGAILVEPKAFYDVAGSLEVEHFHLDRHRRMFAAMRELAKANKPIDSVSVHAAVASPDVSWLDVDSLMNGVPKRTNVAYHASLVVNAWKLRESVKRAAEIITAATAPAAQASEIVEQAQAAYFALSNDAGRKSLWWSDEMTVELSQALEGDRPVLTIPPVTTGLPNVDALFDGFSGGDLAFLAGRPSTGKSAIACQIALKAAEERTVLVVALEMKHTAIWRRALATVGRLRIPTHIRRELTQHEKGLIGRGLKHLGDLRLAIEDAPNASDMQVLATARRVQMQRGLGLVVVDYLQLMRAEGKFRSRGEELGAITRSLKQIAMQLDVPILVLAALSRDAAGSRPRMEHIREVGTAEYDADHIFLMHRDVDAQKELEPGQPSTAELIVEKQRNGATGSLSLTYVGEQYRFESETKV
jgi:replicative DNA helicase